MKHLLYVSLVMVLFIAACKDEPKKETTPVTADQEDSVTETIDTLLSDETVQQFSMSGFSDYARKQAAGFDWSRFRMTGTWQEDSPLVSRFQPEKGFYTDYGPFLKYSPDSTRFIDLDSYNIDIKKDSKGQFIGHEIGPDVEVSLVDVSAGTRTRLLFMGPGGSIEDGMWLDNHTLVLMGVQENEKEEKKATLWRYHMPTQTYYLYELPDTAAARPLVGYWRKERLKQVEIK